ncbi:Acyl-CoA N-acyltransferase [Penicillium griseofulvum]|uniref:N-alpha-acetyltransferase 40 n=1 Tax=Penicillium patulum TaxID=5078 RepID=A0A135LXN3_PENPA|nr:Acyl-CoA N-acyltransferase [Penicillium griseofulvum]KXG53732.1 Acyl-CoA N-acyltransferase [Penicillium griseofulvum]
MQSVKEGRITKSKAKPRTKTRRVSSKMPLVERTNALSIDDFIAQYVTPPTQAEEAKNDAIDQPHLSQNQAQQDMTLPPNVDVYSAATIPTADLEACLNLIEQTSSEAYIASSAGWSRTKKLKEMKLPDMKYLILRPNDSGDSSGHPEKQSDIVDNNAASPLKKSDDPVSSSGTASRIVLGFLSFMVTYEDGKEVVYCYEIHLSPAARGRGVGKLLMGQMERIGRAVGLEKAMLTVFKSNEVARRFYDRLGYEIDGYSPRPRKLRNGTIKDVDYLILSKRLKL